MTKGVIISNNDHQISNLAIDSEGKMFETGMFTTSSSIVSMVQITSVI